jgi:hypothetical protein
MIFLIKKPMNKFMYGGNFARNENLVKNQYKNNYNSERLIYTTNGKIEYGNLKNQGGQLFSYPKSINSINA